MDDMLPGADKEQLKKVCKLFTMLANFPTLLERQRQLPSVLTIVDNIFKTNPSLNYLMPLLQDVQKISSDLPPPPKKINILSVKTKEDMIQNPPDVDNGKPVGKRTNDTIDLTEEVSKIRPSSSSQDDSADRLKRSIDTFSNKPGSFELSDGAVKQKISVMSSEPELSYAVKCSVDALADQPETSRRIHDAISSKPVETELEQSKPVAVKTPLPTLSAIVMQLHEEISQFVETVSGFQKAQLQQILAMLETAPLALVLNDNQRTELKAILLLLNASLKNEISKGEPKALLDNLKLFDEILNKPASFKKSVSSNENQSREKIQEQVETAKSDDSSRPQYLPQVVSGNLTKEVVVVEPIPSHRDSSQDRYMGYMDASSSKPKSSRLLDDATSTKSKHTSKSQLADSEATSTKRKKSPQMKYLEPQEKPNVEKIDVHSKVLEVIRLLQGALTCHLPKIPAGKAKSQLQHVTQMLQYSLENREGDLISESDQIQLTLTMKLLETIIESPDMASSAVAQMKPITSQIQYYLGNLGAGSSSDNIVKKQQSEPSTSGTKKGQKTSNAPEQRKPATKVSDEDNEKQSKKSRLGHASPVEEEEQPKVKRMRQVSCFQSESVR